MLLEPGVSGARLVFEFESRLTKSRPTISRAITRASSRAISQAIPQAIPLPKYQTLSRVITLAISRAPQAISRTISQAIPRFLKPFSNNNPYACNRIDPVTD